MAHFCPYCLQPFSEYYTESAVADKADIENIRTAEVTEAEMDCPECKKRIKIDIQMIPDYRFERK